MADLTTLGVTFHYGVETAKGTKPTAFTWLKDVVPLVEFLLIQSRLTYQHLKTSLHSTHLVDRILVVLGT